MKRAWELIILITLTLVLLSFPAFSWSGKCVGVSDGDTISVMHEGKAEKIRLHGIDCPEMGQPFGKRAKQFTSDMVFGKTLGILPLEQDRYGRTVAWVFAGGKVVNAELVRAGFAWHYKQYSTDEDLALFELDARGKKIGLWSEPNPIPPWDWRHGVRGTTVTEEQPPRSPPSETIVITPTETPKTPAVIPKRTESVTYHGNTQSHIFHRPGCRYYNCKNCTAVFHSREEAIRAGYRPCKVCNP